jgi:hypothetical protein
MARLPYHHASDDAEEVLDDFPGRTIAAPDADG